MNPKRATTSRRVLAAAQTPLVALVLGAGLAAAPQTTRPSGPTVIEIKAGERFVIGEESPPDFAAAMQAADEGAADAPKANSERSKKLKKLVYDRRPSAILAAWSSEPPEPPEKPEAPVEPVEPEPPPELAEDEEPASEPAQDEPAAEGGAQDDPAQDDGAGDDGAPDAEAGDDATVVEETADAENTADAPETTEADTTEPEPTEAEREAREQAEKAYKQARKDYKKAKKEYDKAKKAYDKELKKYEAKLVDHELELLKRYVTLGDWDAVREYFAGMVEDEGKAGYGQLLTSLVKGPPKKPTPYQMFLERNFYAPEDLIGLIAAAPYELEPKESKQLGVIVKACVDAGNLVERCSARLREALEADALGETRSFVARTLMEAGFPLEAGTFLPTADEAIESDERAVLNLIARYELAQHGENGESEHLERAWRVTQAALADGEVEDVDKQEALERAVGLAPRIREELGATWLDESFTARPERGMEILATIGSGASQGLVKRAKEPDVRRKSLELQATATAALLAAAPELAEGWRETLNLLATNWLREAQHAYQYDTSTTLGPSMQRDAYGNFFYMNRGSSRSNRNVPTAVPTAELLKLRPSDAWLEHADDALRPKLDMVTAQLLLKVKEEGEAFPFIERLAVTHPDRATELVEEFLRVWAENNDPNAESRRTSRYMFVYGFERRANAIPLTRSKQERNLTELAGWIERLRALPIDDVDESLVANAFTAAHSQAEVYRVETIERVFGSLGELEPKTLAALIQRMRTNLVSVWRDPAVQKEKGTRRRQKDIQREVQRGYEVALAVAEGALADHPDDWALQLARASVLHDQNNYDQEVAASSEFAARRQEAFHEFARAAELYGGALGELDEAEETTQVYETWFYAALGACDLGAVDSEMQLADAQLAAIEDALEGLPGEAAERHVAMFASTLFTRMSSVNPAVKFRYVRSGLAIAGDHERAREAREVFEYYEDLVTEIRLEARVDGDAQVGTEPFGMFVDLVHTREIEREAGGFSKYLINQNNQSFGYNYGRPTENYRDKFEEAAREALSEHFEVLSITFNHPDAGSRALERYGWRVTPYAYVLLKARGPEIDRVPALRLDLDFLDTTGYAVLPAESPFVALDCGAADPPARPFEGLELVQTLDERQAADGRLVLEVKATARGLVPALDEVLDLAPEGFRVAGVDDPGASVAEFDQESDAPETTVVSDRTWLVRLEAEEDLEALPTTFAFGTAKVDDAELVYQRYVDADLESVEAVVSLEERYGSRSLAPLVGWTVGALFLIVAGFAGFVLLRGPRDADRRAGGPRMPEHVSPFTVIGLLREIESNNGVSDAEREELRRSIAELEAAYFRADARGAAGDGGAAGVAGGATEGAAGGATDGRDPDLERIAAGWLRRVS